MKKIIILALLSGLMAMASRADVLMQDTFNYPNGVTTNVSGGLWIKHSGTASPSDSIVNNHRLEVVTSSTYLGVTVTRQDDVHRMVTNSVYPGTAQTVLYASFVVNFTNLPTAGGAYFAHFYVNSSIFPCRIWALTNGTVLPNTFRIAASTGSASTPSRTYPADLVLNQDYQLVVGYDPVTLDASTLWINPVSSSDVSVTTGDAFTPGTSIATGFGFRQASGLGAFLTVTNLVVATTYDEAATNVWATNAVAPTIVRQPILGITNFVGSTITLSGLATGQGLGSLAYQWQQNGTNYPFGNGNTANILTISPATTNDSGNYTLVATTPYGLSVTSAVSTVSISAGTNPPSFTIQPTSQTAYVGQTVTFSAAVVSPGNPSFQWKSNGVDIAGANLPSFSLFNVQTNFSASYSVAVTNDVNPNGVVSTNAVLTVLNPSQVTIAFLRTLVEPNNYQATNSTTPYQVTGIITTRTNLTTGNTASYYLQDATAGINIFATFGSTFRPAQGDVVTFIGVLSSFSSGLELFANPQDLPFTSYMDLSNNIAALPVPQIIPFTITNNNYPAMNYTIGGRLVEITNVFFGTNAGTTITAPSSGVLTVTVTNGLGQPFNLDFAITVASTQGATLPAYASSVTGVLFGSMNPNSGGVPSPNFAIAITDLSDINTNVPAVPIPLSIGYTGGTLTFNWTDPSFNLQYATNVAGPYTTIDGAASGFTTNTTDQPLLFFRLTHP